MVNGTHSTLLLLAGLLYSAGTTLLLVSAARTAPMGILSFSPLFLVLGLPAIAIGVAIALQSKGAGFHPAVLAIFGFMIIGTAVCQMMMFAAASASV